MPLHLHQCKSISSKCYALITPREPYNHHSSPWFGSTRNCTFLFIALLEILPLRCWWLIWPVQIDAKTWSMTESLLNGYSWVSAKTTINRLDFIFFLNEFIFCCNTYLIVLIFLRISCKMMMTKVVKSLFQQVLHRWKKNQVRKWKKGVTLM